MPTHYKTAVAIIGAGPAGLTLAHLLGSLGVDTLVLEKLPNTMEEPRAIGIDSETLRTLQSADILDAVREEIFSGIESSDYLNADGKLLFSLNTLNQTPYGHPLFNTFDQPAFDRILANTIAKRPTVDIHFQHEMLNFTQDANGVFIEAVDANGEGVSIDTQFLVGCDGGRSKVRDLLGIQMTGDSNEYPWLVIDTIDPQFDDGPGSRFFCDPARPGMTIKRGANQRRWEWMLMPGEQPEQLLKTETINELLAPHTDPAQVDIFRRRVYNFAAIIAERWQQGRAFLAGDAAHMTPPFAGQGLNSGMRDVRNLSWKLAMVVNKQAAPTLLESYQQERWQHAQELIQFALSLGEQIQPIDPQKAAERDAFFFAMQQDPAAMDNFSQDMAQSVLVRAIDKGVVANQQDNAINGQMLPQPQIKTESGETCLLDEKLGKGFSILGYNCDPKTLLTESQLQDWQALGTTLISVGDTNCDYQECGTQRLKALFTDNNCNMILVRPDKFILVALNQDTADMALQQARQLLQLI
jgi:3-(3-hydroxy-phenyl)propionate hydroxylase